MNCDDIVYTFSANSTSVVLSSLFSPADWNSTTPKRVVIPSGITIGSTVTTTAALRTGTGWSGTLTLTVSGTVDGAGGIATSTVGGTGGDAILANQSGLVIVGNGSIRAGGGAGGKGGNGTATTTQGPFYNNSGSPFYVWQNYTGINDAMIWNDAYYLSVPLGATSYSPGDGWTYLRGAFQLNDGGVNYWAVSRQQSTPTTSGNAGRGQGYDGTRTNGVAGRS
jgi:hypothetical protein